MNWKVAIVASRDNQRHLLASYKHLEALGLLDKDDDGLHVFCAKGVKVNDGDKIIRHRPREPEMTEREVWTEAIDTMSRSYSRTTDLFLFTVPNLVYWTGLKRFCEATVEPNYVSLYLPYTPDPFYPDNPAVPVPCATGQKAGWCEHPITEVSDVCMSVVMHRHAARVVATYLQDIMNHHTHCWKNAFSMILSQLAQVRCYCAVPSLATKRMWPAEKLSHDGPILRDTSVNKQDNFYLN